MNALARPNIAEATCLNKTKRDVLYCIMRLQCNTQTNSIFGAWWTRYIQSRGVTTCANCSEFYEGGFLSGSEFKYGVVGGKNENV